MDMSASSEKRLGSIDYQSLLRSADKLAGEELISYLEKELYFEWCEAYESMTERSIEIIRIPCDTFNYLFDCQPLYGVDDSIPLGLQPKPRVVVAYGRSAPRPKARDDYRLKGWLGATEKSFGADWDKGHFIAHSIGAVVDRNEVNVFPQQRHLNRGWSTAGKLFRQMEKECSSSPGAFLFNRPIYEDDISFTPAFLEFGILRSSGELWVERFDNRPKETRS